MSSTAEIIDHPAMESGRKKGAQIESGYGRLANELIEAFAGGCFTKRQYQVIFAIYRETYGRRDNDLGDSKKTNRITLKRMSDITGLSESKSSETIGQLFAMNVLIKVGQGYGEIGFQTDPDEWIFPEKKSKNNAENLPTSQKTKNGKGSQNMGKDSSQKMGSIIDNIYNISNPNGLDIVASDESLDDGEPPKNKKIKKRNKPSLPDCPQQKILDLWTEVFPFKPAPDRVASTSQGHLRTVWRLGFSTKRKHGKLKGEVYYSDVDGGLQWWREFFTYCSKLPVAKQHWFTFEWIIRETNWSKTIAGNYAQEGWKR